MKTHDAHTKKIHSSYIRWGICTTEQAGFFHGARVRPNPTVRRFRRGQDARDRITL